MSLWKWGADIAGGCLKSYNAANHVAPKKKKNQDLFDLFERQSVRKGDTERDHLPSGSCLKWLNPS